LKKYLLRLPAVLLTISIFLLSSMSLDKLPVEGILTFDKLIHIIEFAIYTFSVAIALNTYQAPIIKKHIIIISLLIGFFYGAIDELHQLYVGGRSASIYDWFADFIGSSIGVCIFNKLKNHKFFKYEQTD
jgi:VanZ family protein